jgi:exportin-1
MKFFPVQQFQNDSLSCLTEIAMIKLTNEELAKYNQSLLNLFLSVIQQVSRLINKDTELDKIYEKGDQPTQLFIKLLSLFITGYLKSYLNLLEQSSDTSRQGLLTSLAIALKVSRVEDIDIFKICLDYWNVLVVDLYTTTRLQQNKSLGQFGSNSNSFGLGFTGSSASNNSIPPRLRGYLNFLSELREILISRMAKPEEVLIVEDENGQIVREILKDTDSVILYKSMRECLIYLTHLDPFDAQETMLNKLMKQVSEQEWSSSSQTLMHFKHSLLAFYANSTVIPMIFVQNRSWHQLNTLCWAIGSISGALSEQQEKTFLVRVIKDLLQLCEIKRGKEHKAVIASNIMYVVGQYPRFLRQHWKFLKTVIYKLFEFMHELHPGVQDMSVDTFIKIARKCKKKIIALQPNESRPFIEEIVENLGLTIKDLEPAQIRGFYEACGEIISAESDPSKRQNLIYKLMELPNQSWTQIITAANHNTEILFDSKTVRQIVLVLQTNSKVCNSLKSHYIVQLSRIYLDMLQCYRMYSGFVSMKVSKDPQAVRHADTKLMRSVKKESLNLIKSFVVNSSDSDKEVILTKFVPQLLDFVLTDYKQNVADAREMEVLALFTEIINKVGVNIVQNETAFEVFFSKLFDHLFQCTLEMINKDFQSFPDHRVNFFRLLQAINSKSFSALLRLNPQQFQLCMDSIIWAMQHLDRNIADIGLETLNDLLINIQKSEVSNQFYQTYFLSLLSDLLGLLTDTFHKPGFKFQSSILAHLFDIVANNHITIPLFSGNNHPFQGQNFPNNQTFVKTYTCHLLHKHFSNVSQQQIEMFVDGLFKLNRDIIKFKEHIRDFLIQLKEFNPQPTPSNSAASNANNNASITNTNEDLYLEEKAAAQANEEKLQREKLSQVPGLLFASKIDQEDQDEDGENNNNTINNSNNVDDDDL